jgi:phosphoribosyl-ATP pyrophosphohydrolase
MQKQTKTKILKKELADILGCLPIVVSRLIKKGEVKTEPDGRIDISNPSMQRYIEDKKLEIQKHKERTTKRELKAIDNEQRIIDDKIDEKNKELLNSKEQTQQTNIYKESNNLNFHILELETKKHKLESEKCKAELLGMEVKQRRKELITLELLNKIISKTIGNLAKNIAEIPILIADEIIDTEKT